MGRKIAIALAILIFLASIGAGYVVLKNKDKVDNTDVFHAVPSDALFILRINHEESTLAAGQWFPSERSTEVFTTIQRLLEDERYAYVLQPSYLLLSAHPQTDGASDLLYFVAFPTEISSRDLLDRACVLANISTDNELAAIPVPDSSSLYARQLGRYVALSFSSTLVEAAKAQWTSSQSLEQNEAFAEAVRIAGRNCDINLMLNNTLLQALPINSRNDSLGGALSLLSSVSKQGWLSLDGDISNDLCQLSGFWTNGIAVDSTNRLFAGGSPMELDMLRSLPYNTGYAFVTGVSNVDSLLLRYEATLSSRNLLDAYTNRIGRMSDSSNVNLREFFTSLVPQQMAIAYIPKADGTGEWISLLKVASGEVAREQIKELAKQNESANPLKGMMGTLLGGLFTENSEQYYDTDGDLLLFSGSKQLLDEQRTSQRSLYTQLARQGIIDLLADDAAALLFVDPQYLPNKPTSSGQFTLYDKLTLQLSVTGGKVYCNAALPAATQAGDTKPEKPVATAPDIDTTHTKPAIVATPVPTPTEAAPTAEPPKPKPSSTTLYRQTAIANGREYQVEQRTDFTLTITPAKGSALTLKPDGAVLNVVALQLSAKGDWRWLYNTAGKLYMVDNDGKTSQGFPVNFTAKATNPLAVYDYGNTRDYRIFVACADRRLYLFNKTGEAVEGWSPKQTASVVTSPVRFFRVGGKDYIVAADGNNLYVLDRKGNERVKPKEKVAIAPNSKLNALGNPSRITCTDMQGRQVSVYLSDGRVERR